MPDDIEFKLVTKGDVSGAEEVEKSIFKAADAAEEARRQADVDAVQAKQAAEAAEEQAAALAELVTQAERLVASGLADTIGEVGEQFKGISPEADLALDSVKNFLSTFAETGNPIPALLAVVGTAVGGVVTAYKEAAEVTKKLAKKEQDNIKKIAELRSDLARQIRTESLVAFFQAENDKLDDQEKTLARIVRLRQSQRELDAIQQSADGAEGVRGGGNADAAAARQSALATGNEIAGLNDALEQQRTALASLKQKASDTALAADALNAAGFDADAAVDARKAQEDAAKAADDAAAEFATFQQETLNRIQGLVIAGGEKIASIGDSALDNLTQSVQKERDALAAEVERLGASAGQNARTALATYDKALADAVIKPEELASLVDAQNRVRTSQEIYNTQVRQAFEETNRGLGAITETIQPLLAEMAARGRDIEQLKLQVQSLQSRR